MNNVKIISENIVTVGGRVYYRHLNRRLTAPLEPPLLKFGQGATYTRNIYPSQIPWLNMKRGNKG